MSPTEVMISILAVIIAMSIAYNFHAIWKSDNTIKSIEDKVLTFEESINKKVSDIEFLIKRNELYAEHIRLDANVTNNYLRENWLQGLKQEFEIVSFLCDNSDYFKDEFRGKIGMKRASISAILLNLNGFDNTMISKYDKYTIDDIYLTIINKWGNIKTSHSYPIVLEYEKTAYEELFTMAEGILKEIRDGRTPIALPQAVVDKLNYYKTLYGN